MRSHGVASFPDPTVGKNGMPNFNIQSNGNSDLNPNSSQWKGAQSVCRKDLPNGGVETPAQKAAAKGKALKYTACMRAHGEPDFPDPSSTGTIQLSTPTGILNPTSPQFKEATKACKKLDTGFSESVRAVAPGPGPGSPQGPGGAGS